MRTLKKKEALPKPLSHIVSLSAECSGIAQRGGLGSVVWGLNDAYAQHGHHVSLIIPFYEEVTLPVRNYTTLDIEFGSLQYHVPVLVGEMERFTAYFISSEKFFRGDYANVYIDSGKLGRGYFEDDARRFAFFCKAAVQLLAQLNAKSPVDSLHCHDWHTAYALLLLKKNPAYTDLSAKLKTVFTIHNLEYQGTRPLAQSNGELLSFLDYFPELAVSFSDFAVVKQYLDPHADIPCVNPMRAALYSADVVTTVSPTYAKEICLADDPKTNFFGGRGLEKDLQILFAENKLFGILNGIDYAYYDTADLKPAYAAQKSTWPKVRMKHRVALAKSFKTIFDSLTESRSLMLGDFSLKHKLQSAPKSVTNLPWVTIISRMTGQKISILLEVIEGKTVLKHILDRKIFCVLLGKGDLQETIEAESRSYANALLFAGFDDNLEKDILASSDLFLMPSDFEPCGTSQMKAMCYGSVPLVHHVGGLVDSVEPDVDGFAFHGDSRESTARGLLVELDRAIRMINHNSKEFRQLQLNSMLRRFSWQKASEDYLQLLKN